LHAVTDRFSSCNTNPAQAIGTHFRGRGTIRCAAARARCGFELEGKLALWLPLINIDGRLIADINANTAIGTALGIQTVRYGTSRRLVNRDRAMRADPRAGIASVTPIRIQARSKRY
jgi:hypothetical protein